MPNRIIVTGGAGFIGSHLVDRLLGNGFEVTVIDNLSSGKLENINDHATKEAFHLVRGDIRNYNLVKKAVKEADAIFHEAAMSSWSDSWKSLLDLNQVNINGTLTLLKTCIDSNVKRFIYASSASVYGEANVQPQHEGLTPKPISPYGVSKLSAEQFVQVFHKLYGLETICLRYFNVYGLRQMYGPYSSVITNFINRMLRNSRPIIYGDGEQTRDFTYVDDAVQANIKAAESPACGIFNVSGGKRITINTLARMIMEKIGKNIEIIHTDPRPGDIMHSLADISRAGKHFNYKPEIDLETGIMETIKWFQK